MEKDNTYKVSEHQLTLIEIRHSLNISDLLSDTEVNYHTVHPGNWINVYGTPKQVIRTECSYFSTRESSDNIVHWGWSSTKNDYGDDINAIKVRDDVLYHFGFRMQMLSEKVNGYDYDYVLSLHNGLVIWWLPCENFPNGVFEFDNNVSEAATIHMLQNDYFRIKKTELNLEYEY